MQQISRCGLASLLVVIAACAMAACADDNEPAATPTSPSPRGVAGAQGVTLASLSLSESAVFGQQGVVGSVTLSGSAPSGGALVTLSSTDSVARVNQNVMVTAGTSSATFTVDTSTVGATTPVTINASYGGVSRSASLSVKPPQVVAAFTVTSPTKGSGGCVLLSIERADCTLDGRGSKGPITQWIWRYWTGNNPVTRLDDEAASTLQLPTRCLIFDGGRGGDGPGGDRYVHLTIELVVQDREGNRSAPVVQAARLYPNRLCGFTY
jgi:hypothetical protein